ncbi:MAG: hypothetical protein FD130_1219 [Halothiobacillaceae bacterium]|nr:MAG: hypothetical protein FD130_1219 [Halothiobacillaceae bacterium]
MPTSSIIAPQDAAVSAPESPAVPSVPVKPVTTQTEVIPPKKIEPKANPSQVKPLRERNESKRVTGGATQNIKQEASAPAAASTSASASALSGTTKNGAPPPAPSPPVSAVAKAVLLQDFVASYEKGDIGGFVQLFDQNAVSDKGETLKEISSDYRDLFEATDMRRMSLNNFKWEKSATGALRGKGEFEVNVWLHDRDDPVTSSGMIEFDVVNENGRLAIKKLSHYPQ